MLVGLSPLSDLKSCMCSFVVLGSQWINFVERNHSSFDLVVSLLCVGDDLPLSSNVDKGC
jgi:hypothetical protein